MRIIFIIYLRRAVVHTRAQISLVVYQLLTNTDVVVTLYYLDVGPCILKYDYSERIKHSLQIDGSIFYVHHSIVCFTHLRKKVKFRFGYNRGAVLFNTLMLTSEI